MQTCVKQKVCDGVNYLSHSHVLYVPAVSNVVTNKNGSIVGIYKYCYNVQITIRYILPAFMNEYF